MRVVFVACANVFKTFAAVVLCVLLSSRSYRNVYVRVCRTRAHTSVRVCARATQRRRRIEGVTLWKLEESVRDMMVFNVRVRCVTYNGMG